MSGAVYRARDLAWTDPTSCAAARQILRFRLKNGCAQDDDIETSRNSKLSH
jgi:hypothetical protein